jgi:hypothetical protein
VTDSKYHMYWATVFAKAAELHVLIGNRNAAQWSAKICIYHLALAFHKLSFECRECERYR